MAELEPTQPHVNSPNNTQDLKIYEETLLNREKRLKSLGAEEYSPPTPSRERSLKGRGVNDLTHTFQNMHTPQGFQNVYDAFRGLSEGTVKYYMLLVYGGTGNGKTMCCEATVIEMYDRGLLSKRDRWSDIVRHLKELMKKGGYEEYFNELRARPRLILDDVGSGSTGGAWEWGELEDIIDYRLERRLLTIITTNLDIKDIPPRIISRFKDKSKARLILNEAPDQRPNKLPA